jgi:hypothetical protein
MRVELLGYVSQWHVTDRGCCAHVTTLAEHDLHLWTLTALAEPYRRKAQWLRLRGLIVGTWLVATEIARAPAARAPAR